MKELYSEKKKKRLGTSQNLVKGINLQIQEPQWVQKRLTLMPGYIIGKLLKIQDKKNILKAARENWHIIYKGKW